MHRAQALSPSVRTVKCALQNVVFSLQIPEIPHGLRRPVLAPERRNEGEVFAEVPMSRVGLATWFPAPLFRA